MRTRQLPARLLSMATLALLFLIGPARPAQQPLPASPEQAAQQRIREFIEVANSEDTARLRQYISDNFAASFLQAIPLDEHVRIISMGREQSGGFDLQRVAPFGKGRAAGVLQSRRGKDWMRIILTVEDAPPFRIANISIMPSGPILPEVPAGPLTDVQIVGQIKKYLDEASAAGQFSGAVLIAKEGKPLFKAAYGLANRSDGVPNPVDTKFNLGSMNKMFTAVAIGQLAEKGKLSYDDPVSKYLTDWLPADVAQKVKLYHLLTHTSGLGSYFGEKFFKASREQYRKIDDYKPLVAEEKLQFEPGTKWSYSNTGFLLLGAVVEKVTGQSYFDYVRANIYQPAGMTHTDAYEMDDIVPNLAIGYTRRNGKWRNNLYMHVIKGGPAGGGFSTVEDLSRFDAALRNHKLLSAESTKLLLTAKPERNSPSYGYGFQVEDGGTVVGHSGGFPGISSNLSMFLTTGYTLAVMSNVDAGAVDAVDLFKAMVHARDERPAAGDTFNQAVPAPK